MEKIRIQTNAELMASFWLFPSSVLWPENVSETQKWDVGNQHRESLEKSSSSRLKWSRALWTLREDEIPGSSLFFHSLPPQSPGNPMATVSVTDPQK